MHNNYPPSQPLGELEMQQALNVEEIIRGAQVCAMYLNDGETVTPELSDLIIQDLLAVTNQQ